MESTELQSSGDSTVPTTEPCYISMHYALPSDMQFRGSNPCLRLLKLRCSLNEHRIENDFEKKQSALRIVTELYLELLGAGGTKTHTLRYCAVCYFHLFMQLSHTTVNYQ
jgi:hypothetical protein